MLRIAALAAVSLLCSSPALAWGGLGHEAVCELAFQELDDTARQRVAQLIALDERYDTFRASCNWPDRPEQRARSSEHFVNLPRDATGIGDDRCPLAEKCVLTAIESDLAVLASPDATDMQKLDALKYLGHWVGDVHEPLHASFVDDRGGNRIRARGTSCDSLHAVWDRCLLEEGVGMEPLTIVEELRAGITDEQRAEWLAADPVAWAVESFAIARQPSVGYCVTVGPACQYLADNLAKDDGEPQKVVLADAAYLGRHAPIVRERIAMAGVRLAGLLNQALGDQAAERSLRAELLSRIDAISRELATLRAAVEALER